MREAETIAVLGAGTMGAGIAQVAALAGYTTFLHDVDDELVQRGVSGIGRFLARGVSKGKVTEADRSEALGRIRGTAELETAVGAADLVIEAVPERMALKRQVFAEVEKLCPPEAVLATNTSSLSIDELAAGTRRPGAFLGMHFFNPVPLMKLLEIVVGRDTREDVVAAARAVGERMGKTVITVQDSPGFATSRLGSALAMEAIRMLEEGVASVEDLDNALALGYGHPMGPLRLTDLVGLDVRLAIAEHLYEKLGRETFRPPELLRRLVSEGKLGKKAGRGFYDWSA